MKSDDFQLCCVIFFIIFVKFRIYRCHPVWGKCCTAIGTWIPCTEKRWPTPRSVSGPFGSCLQEKSDLDHGDNLCSRRRGHEISSPASDIGTTDTTIETAGATKKGDSASTSRAKWEPGGLAYIPYPSEFNRRKSSSPLYW